MKVAATMRAIWRGAAGWLRNHASRRRSAQGLVEFAIVSMLLFFLIFGIIEAARLMFVWSQVASAAQEGVRYGSTHPREIAPIEVDAYPAGLVTAGGANWGSPCNITDQARARVVLVSHDDVSVEVGYDDGTTTAQPFNDGFEVGVDRVVVTSTYQFHFVLGIFDKFLPA